MFHLQLENDYFDKLPGFYTQSLPDSAPEPNLLQFNAGLAEELGLDTDALDSAQLGRMFSGNELPETAKPLAQAYAGHQFGGFVPQLGDGRALLLGELVDAKGNLRDVALKGSGPTPFSRGGDGKAAVGPVLREYLMGEAMHALGVPTTRALAAVATGESVRRELPLPGAVLTRVASSHIRVGTFQFFAARQKYDQVRLLADYVVDRHYPELVEEETDRYLLLLRAVAEKQALLIANWMRVGFIHGVMNTDNMAIAGETIDYGPCAFMESYSAQTVFSSIDSGGRYAYGNQPMMAGWNLARFAETLLPLIDEADPERAVEAATEVIEGFVSRYEELWLVNMRAKMGLSGSSSEDEADRKIVQEWLELIEEHQVDFTLAWRRLADAAEGNTDGVTDLFPSADLLQSCLESWQSHLGESNAAETAQSMRAQNPIYIPRNHLIEEALAAATENGDLSLFERLLEVVSHPYEERTGLESYAQPAPPEFTACYKTFCGT